MLVNFFVFSIVVSSCLIVSIEAKTNEASQINKYLSGKCRNNGFDENLAAAKEFLEESRSNNQNSLVKDLETFISLEQIENGSQECNGESYQILMANDELVGGNLNKKVERSTSNLSRLESVVYSVMLKHAQTCPEVYGKKYDQARKSPVESEIIKKAADATRKASSLLTISDKHIERTYAQLLHQDLARLAKQANDPDAEYVFSPSGKRSSSNYKLESLMEKYIRQPCMKYVDTFGLDLFKPAGFDARLESSMIRIYLRDGDTYYTCLNLLDNQFYRSILNSMSMLASEPELEYKYMIMSRPRRRH